MFNKPYLIDIETQAITDLETTVQQVASVASLADLNGARVILCATIEPPPSSIDSIAMQDRIVDVRKRNATRVLQEIADRIETENDPELLIATGKPFIAISRLVMEHDVGVVVNLTADGIGHPVNSRLMHLVRKCPSAVWLCRDRAATPSGSRPAHIVIPIDRDIFAGSDAPEDMVARLFDAALMAAGNMPARITLVHAWSSYGLDVLRDSAVGLDDKALQKYIDGQRYAHEVWLDERHEQLRDLITADPGLTAVTTERTLLEGNPAEVVPAWLETSGADLLVIGTAGTGAVPGQLIGDTAETILVRSQLPVVAVKPADFRSPVVAITEPQPAIAAA